MTLTFKMRRRQLNRKGFHEKYSRSSKNSAEHVFESSHGARKVVITDKENKEVIKEYT